VQAECKRKFTFSLLRRSRFSRAFARNAPFLGPQEGVGGVVTLQAEGLDLKEEESLPPSQRLGKIVIRVFILCVAQIVTRHKKE
jgi:hypothetical protein